MGLRNSSHSWDCSLKWYTLPVVMSLYGIPPPTVMRFPLNWVRAKPTTCSLYSAVGTSRPIQCWRRQEIQGNSCFWMQWNITLAIHWTSLKTSSMTMTVMTYKFPCYSKVRPKPRLSTHFSICGTWTIHLWSRMVHACNIGSGEDGCGASCWECMNSAMCFYSTMSVRTLTLQFKP